MPRTILITGATGNIGAKLAKHLAPNYPLQQLCLNPQKLPGITTADLAEWSETWAREFQGVHTVIHLAGDPSPKASWASVQRLNIQLFLNVLEAARLHQVKRVVFASSNWVLAGYHDGDERLTPETPPFPINPYGHSKLFGEMAGNAFAARTGISFIAFRIGWCQRLHDNRPGPHMSEGSWLQQMWVSDRDICHAMERAVLTDHPGFAILNLMSDNPGMRWDIEPTRRLIGYAPRDGHTAVITPEQQKIEAEALARYRA